MGGSRIFDWGGPRIEKARDDRQHVALFTLKSWSIGGGHGPVPPPPGAAHESGQVRSDVIRAYYK